VKDKNELPLWPPARPKEMLDWLLMAPWADLKTSLEGLRQQTLQQVVEQCGGPTSLEFRGKLDMIELFLELPEACRDALADTKEEDKKPASDDGL
jgi:hypothetical protein